MAVTLTTKLGLPQWSAGADPFTRAQMNAAMANLETRLGSKHVEHTWTIPGDVKVPSGVTDYLVPFFIYKEATEELVLDRAMHTLGPIYTGTVTAKLRLATGAAAASDVTGFTGISIQNTGGTELNPADVPIGAGVAGFFRVELVVTAVAGTVGNMTFTTLFRLSPPTA